MKQIIILTVFCGGLLIESAASGNPSIYAEYTAVEQSPVSFMNSVPSRIKINDRVDLSFFVNQSVIFQYRLKLEVPKGAETSIAKSLLAWSEWNNQDINRIIVPKLEKEGKYKLVIEYKTHTSVGTIKFEKQFEVYSENSAKVTASEPAKTSVIAKSSAVLSSSTVGKIKKEQTPSPGSVKKDDLQKQSTANTDNESVAIAKDANPAGGDQLIDYASDTLEKPGIDIVKVPVDYNLLLMESIANQDIALIQEAIDNGAGKDYKGIYGGNIFHILDEKTASERLISTLKSRGLSIDETDNAGNSPLHYAILKGRSAYAKLLIDQGASLELKDRLDLSPLHLAVYMNNSEVTNKLLSKGAIVDIRGNTGYTPLHMASEMNHMEIARDLMKRSNGKPEN